MIELPFTFLSSPPNSIMYLNEDLHIQSKREKAIEDVPLSVACSFASSFWSTSTKKKKKKKKTGEIDDEGQYFPMLTIHKRPLANAYIHTNTSHTSNDHYTSGDRNGQ
jgi:hypothetical protein